MSRANYQRLSSEGLSSLGECGWPGEGGPAELKILVRAARAHEAVTSREEFASLRWELKERNGAARAQMGCWFALLRGGS